MTLERAANWCLFSGILFLSACSQESRDELPSALEEKMSVEVIQSTSDQPDQVVIDSKPTEEAVARTEPLLPKSAFKSVEWIDLMPKADLDAILNPPSYITDVEEGAVNDVIGGPFDGVFETDPDDRYQRALVSTNIVPEMNGQAIRLPGFVVPLEFDDDQTITQFFLVPFFGACIHVPPPPPNQIILVNATEGIQVDALYDPFWISGVLTTDLVENELATAAYTLDMQHFEIYSE